MKKLFVVIGAVMMAIAFAGCNSESIRYKKKLEIASSASPVLEFKRYEDVLFTLDTADFQHELMAIQMEYQPFLDGDLRDPMAVKYLKDFAIDPFSRLLYQKVKAAFPDLDEVKTMVEGVYRHFNQYYPDIVLPHRVFTCISGINSDIPPVMILDDALVISLDWYLDGDEVYDQIGVPKYRSERTALPFLVKDLGVLLYQNYVQKPHKQTNLLEEMVYEGKALFFVEAMCPSLPDRLILGYSDSQMMWAEENEGNLWADLVGNQQLYSSEYEVFRIFFADGPFTNEYSHEAPPRLGEFLGLQMIRSYMNNHDCSLQDVMQNTDLQGIFQDSRYKPKK